MSLTIINELISIAIGIVTSVLVPILNKKFGWKLNPASVGTIATEVVDDAEKAFEKKPATLPVTTTPATTTPTVTAIPTSLQAPTQNPTGTDIAVPPMSKPLDLSAIPPHEDGAK